MSKDVMDILEVWVKAHSDPDEPVICVPDGETGAVSPRQFLADIKRGKPYTLGLFNGMKEILKDLDKGK